MHLVYDLRVRHEPVCQSPCELETKVETTGPYVEQQVSGSRHSCVPSPGQLAELVQARWARRAEEPVPQLRAQTHHAGEAAVGDPETD